MFDNATVWITGASSGIGEALARQLAKKHDARLILSGRNVAELKRVAAHCGGAEQCLVLPFEATDFAALPGIVEKAVKWAGRIDMLVNNAGISQRSLAVDTPFSVYRTLIDIDLMGPIALTQAVLPHMVANKAGRLVYITSVAGKVGSPMRTAYSAAKFGLNGYADSLRTEVAGLGLNVHVIAPGSTRTNVSRNAITADGTRRGESDAAIEKGMDPTATARRMLREMEKGKRDIVIAKGVEAHIAALKRVAPEKLFDEMEAMVAKGYAQKMQGSGEEQSGDTLTHP